MMSGVCRKSAQEHGIGVMACINGIVAELYVRTLVIRDRPKYESTKAHKKNCKNRVPHDVS